MNVTRAVDASDTVSTSGFTLVEMLVVLSIIAIMSLMGSTFLYQLRIWTEDLSGREYQTELDAAVRHIERSVENALPLPIDLSDNNNRRYFDGGPTGMNLVTHARAGTVESAFRTIQFGLDNSAREPNLYQALYLRRFGIDDNPGRSTRETILHDVQKLTIEYLSLDRDNHPQWTAAWDRNRALPLAVRFEITLERNSKFLTSRGMARVAAATAVAYP